jgi:cytochrome c peroxidase
MLNAKKLAFTALLAVSVCGGVTAHAADQALIAKGEKLFQDTSLSASGKTACATCHPGGGHTDNKTYVGLDVVADGDPKGRSTPTMWGMGMRSAYSWAGTAPNLEANIKAIIVNRMKGAEPSPETLTALAAYVSSLKVPHSAHVSDDGAPTDKAPDAVKRGYALFVGDGECGACHVLPTFDKAEVEDVGTGGKFKVPSLWSVSKTGPYFHNGHTASLKEAVETMWIAQKQKTGSASKPTAQQIDDLVAYLQAL